MLISRPVHSRILLPITLLAVVIAAGKMTNAIEISTLQLPVEGQPMVARIDAVGTIHVAFDSKSGPQYIRSSDNGKSFDSPVRLVDHASQKPGLEFIVWDMAVTKNGAVHVALGNNAWKLKLPKEEWGFFYTHRLPSQPGFTPLKNINHKPSEGFSLAVLDQGTVTAVWMADKLFANISHDGGETFSETVEIDPALDPCNCCTTSSVYGNDGRLAVLYREETNNERDMHVALWDQQNSRVTKVRVGSTPWQIDSCPMTYYSLTRSTNGYVAAWPTKGQIYFARLDATGASIGPKEILTPGSNGIRTGVLNISTKDGQTLVAWKKDRELGWQLYDADGKPIGKPQSAKSPGSGAAGVLTKNGSLILFK